MSAQHPELPPWSAFRTALREAGFRPTKTRGQNFLVDANMARAIAADAGVGPGDFVLEVGPGCGMLSVQLAARGVRLLAVELDPRLARVAAQFLASSPAARVVVADVLAGKHRLAPAVVDELPTHGPWHVVANLPYAIVGPLLVLLARLEHPPTSLTVLVQRELAERVAAPAGSPARSALSAKLQLLYRARVGRAVGRQLFRPRPRVESAVLHLARRDAAPVPPADFDALVEALFGQRRKRVGGSLRRLLGITTAAAEELLCSVGVDPDLRPGDLTLDQLAALAAHPAWRARGQGFPPGAGPGKSLPGHP